MMTDIRAASLQVLAMTLVFASTSATIAGITGMLDRRRTCELLHFAGSPLSVLDGVRLRETLAPLSLMGGGALMTGMFCAAPLAASAGVALNARSLKSLAMLAALAIVGTVFA